MQNVYQQYSQYSMKQQGSETWISMSHQTALPTIPFSSFSSASLVHIQQQHGVVHGGNNWLHKANPYCNANSNSKVNRATVLQHHNLKTSYACQDPQQSPENQMHINAKPCFPATHAEWIQRMRIRDVDQHVTLDGSF